MWNLIQILIKELHRGKGFIQIWHYTIKACIYQQNDKKSFYHKTQGFGTSIVLLTSLILISSLIRHNCLIQLHNQLNLYSSIFSKRKIVERHAATAQPTSTSYSLALQLKHIEHRLSIRKSQRGSRQKRKRKSLDESKMPGTWDPHNKNSRSLQSRCTTVRSLQTTHL